MLSETSTTGNPRARARLALCKAKAFIARDLIIDASYKAAFAVEVLRALVPLLAFFFISKMMPGEGLAILSRYGGGYFPFVIVGLGLGHYLTHALHAFAAVMRRDMTVGCLEAMLSTRTSPQLVILLSPLYSFLFKSLHVLLVLLAGWALGADFSRCNVLSAVVTLLVSIAAFGGIGILLAAVLVVLKKGDPIEWVLGAGLSLISGVYFPLEVLPSWLRQVSQLSPLTHAVEAMRLAMLQGWSPAQLGGHLGALALLAAVLLPAGVWCFGRAVEQGRRDGSLMQY